MIFSRTSEAFAGSGWIRKGFFALLCAAALGFAKDGPVELLQRHRYEEAIALWQKDLQGARTGDAALRALKGQALAYFQLGSLYENLGKFSLVIMGDYYAQVAESSTTPLVALYLGQILIYQGKPAEAKPWLEKARATGSETIKDMAAVYLQAAGGASVQPNTTDAQWQALDLKRSDASAMGTLQAHTPRSRRCQLSLLARTASPNRLALEKAVAAVVRDGQDPEALFDQGKNTQINFYDPDLMGALARGYFSLAKAMNLELLEAGKSNPELAAKFRTSLALAEVAMRLGQMEEASRHLGNDASQSAQLLRAGILARSKKIAEAEGLLDGLAAKAGRNAVQKRAIAEVYYLSGLNTDKGLQLIEQALKDKNGTAYYRVYAGLLLAKGQGDAAIQQYAKGYKIEFRNRIDQIDPEYMSEYSFALYRNNKLRYEEIVETLYHLQKEFPPSRQMHYCMQGVSAGLARSFESQRIFRKGG